MPILLKVDSSPLGERSISRKLTEEFAKTWIKSHRDGSVISPRLDDDGHSRDRRRVAAAYTPEGARTAGQKEILRVSDTLIAELQKADEYVVGCRCTTSASLPR